MYKYIDKWVIKLFYRTRSNKLWEYKKYEERYLYKIEKKSTSERGDNFQKSRRRREKYFSLMNLVQPKY